MSTISYLDSTGPGEDLETFAYIRHHYTFLPNPPGLIPFGIQGRPLPDMSQKHVQQPQVKQATTIQKTNDLPYGHFVGTFHRQINQPQFLSVNDQLFEQ